jgi:CheY-like chemotaxis protein
VNGPAKILAVDDEVDFEQLIRQRFRRQIRAREFDFRFAQHGEEALAVLEREPDVELMLLDINMPVMDGLTLLREIKNRRPELPVMMVTAYGDDERRRVAGEYGAAEFINKPVDFDLLKAQLQSLPEQPA